ncbi:unnamed protein product [[Candida] boidinii]|nr:unnamed protein product [[Candida] boidinii]
MMSILYHSIDHALTDATAQVIVVCLMCIIMKYMDSGSLEHQEHQEHQEHREHREHREYQEQKSLLFQMFNYYQQGWLVGLFCQFIIHQCKLMTIRNLQGGEMEEEDLEEEDSEEEEDTEEEDTEEVTMSMTMEELNLATETGTHPIPERWIPRVSLRTQRNQLHRRQRTT